MPFPYTRYRSRNRTRPDQKVPPNVASVGGPSLTVTVGGDITATFPEPMDTNNVTPPAGFVVNAVPVHILSWNSPTEARVSIDGVFTAGMPYTWPANNTNRGASGGPSQAVTSVLVSV